ncbi:MAG: peptidoglycan DD-metalloendopeptidase family protein [Patescibacteria group bacterium]
MMRKKIFAVLALCSFCLWTAEPFFAQAQETLVFPDGTVNEATETSVDETNEDVGIKEEIDELNSQVQDKSQAVKRLDSAIQKYRSKIAEQENAMMSLANEVLILESRAKEKQLATERTRQQIELMSLEIQAMTEQIRLDEAIIKRRQDALADIVRRIHHGDQISVVDAFLARPSISEVFTRLEEMKRVEEDLADATRRLQAGKKQLENGRSALEVHRLSLQEEKTRLQNEKQELEMMRQAKMALVSETQSREQEFERIVYELRAQQQSEKDEISSLEERLRDRLNSADEALARGDILLYWPVETTRGITARFHDPSYPFRKMFEHPGLDVAVSAGTPVRAAAGGYVAWTRTGKQYGNYIMLIHAGGVATVYAHLSRFAVKADTYVERGDIIGYSGGIPGTQGAGLTTGPHLHFEVRQSGIPVNPENFLPAIE